MKGGRGIRPYSVVSIIAEEVRNNPDLPSRTLARIIYAKNPSAFLDLESVRSGVRYLRGLNKSKNRGGSYGKYASDRGK